MTPIPRAAKPAVGAARRPGHIASYGDDRSCAEPSCSTTLSRYNSSELCSCHSDPPERSRRRH